MSQGYPLGQDNANTSPEFDLKTKTFHLQSPPENMVFLMLYKEVHSSVRRSSNVELLLEITLPCLIGKSLLVSQALLCKRFPIRGICSVNNCHTAIE